MIPDTTPLIHLAAGGALGVLIAMGRVIVPDVVALEATRLRGKPWAAEIGAWLKAEAVEIVDTEIGGLYRLAVEMGRRPPKNAGEIGIVAWLRDNPAAMDQGVLVVFEDPRLRRLIEIEGLAQRVAAFTTRSFLEYAAERGIIPSARAALDAVERGAPTASRTSFRSLGKLEP